MHRTAHQAGKAFFECYWRAGFASVLDVGSRDVNGTLRDVAPPGCRYVGLDIEEGPAVDVVHLVPEDPMPFDRGSFDAIVSTSCFEHDRFFWLTFLHMIDVLKPRGFIYVNAPSNGSYHSHPYDNWRFYPDSGLALAAWARKNGHTGVRLIESMTLRRGKGAWNDCVMIFGGAEAEVPARLLSDLFPDSFNIRRGEEEGVLNLTLDPEERVVLQRTEARLAETATALETAKASGEAAREAEAAAEAAREDARAAQAKARRLEGRLLRAERRAERKAGKLRALKRSAAWRIAKPLQRLGRRMKWKRREPAGSG